MNAQYLEKEISYEVDFLHADKYQSFLQVDFNTLGIKVSSKVIVSLFIIIHQAFSISLQCLYNNSKKKLELEFIFACR